MWVGVERITHDEPRPAAWPWPGRRPGGRFAVHDGTHEPCRSKRPVGALITLDKPKDELTVLAVAVVLVVAVVWRVPTPVIVTDEGPARTRCGGTADGSRDALRWPPARLPRRGSVHAADQAADARHLPEPEAALNRAVSAGSIRNIPIP